MSISANVNVQDTTQQIQGSIVTAITSSSTIQTINLNRGYIKAGTLWLLLTNTASSAKTATLTEGGFTVGVGFSKTFTIQPNIAVRVLMNKFDGFSKQLNNTVNIDLQAGFQGTFEAIGEVAHTYELPPV